MRTNRNPFNTLRENPFEGCHEDEYYRGWDPPSNAEHRERFAEGVELGGKIIERLAGRYGKLRDPEMLRKVAHLTEEKAQGALELGVACAYRLHAAEIEDGGAE
jgi:hypothetical protein